MRKTILTIVILALIWTGYVAWPLYDLFRIVGAIERHDIATITRHIDFNRVRMSFAQQIVESYLKRTGARVGPRIQGAALSIADPVIAKFISAEALTELLRIGWPVIALPERPRDSAGLSVASLGTFLDVFAQSDYGIGRFEVTVPVTFPADRAFGLEMRLVQWRWRLSGVRLPEHIVSLLVDEIIKPAKPELRR